MRRSGRSWLDGAPVADLGVEHEGNWVPEGKTLEDASMVVKHATLRINRESARRCRVFFPSKCHVGWTVAALSESRTGRPDAALLEVAIH